MRALDPHSIFWLTLCFGLGGSVLGLACRLAEARRPRLCGVLFRTVLATTFAGLAVIAWLTEQFGGMLLSGTGLAAVCLLRWGPRLTSPSRTVLRLLRPHAVWGGLVVGCAVVSWHLASHLEERASALKELTPDVDATPVRNEEWLAQTDRGHEVPLYIFVARTSAAKAEQSILARDYLRHQVIRLAPPDPSSNCHGWVFTGGQCAIPNQLVDQILADNRYQRVDLPKQGDLIVYRNERGEVEHTGIVEAIGEDGLVLIKSKWGPIGLYIHPPHAQPWSGHHAYYRSPRPGHRLKILPTKKALKGRAIA